MQDDVNFVLYDQNNQPVWASNTDGFPGADRAVQDDGNLVVYLKGNALWASNTGAWPPPARIVPSNIPVHVPRPADSHFVHDGSFHLDRWLHDGAAPRYEGHDTRTFPPFGAISHDCPGRNLAMFEATMVAAMLVRSFEITRRLSAPAVGERFAFTYQPVGLTARLTARPAADRPP